MNKEIFRTPQPGDDMELSLAEHSRRKMAAAELISELAVGEETKLPSTSGTPAGSEIGMSMHRLEDEATL
jgi:hypothetical protein